MEGLKIAENVSLVKAVPRTSTNDDIIRKVEAMLCKGQLNCILITQP
jgi:hypothetical protein